LLLLLHNYLQTIQSLQLHHTYVATVFGRRYRKDKKVLLSQPLQRKIEEGLLEHARPSGHPIRDERLLPNNHLHLLLYSGSRTCGFLHCQLGDASDWIPILNAFRSPPDATGTRELQKGIKNLNS
jgi:hypothetical protein